MSTNTRFNIVDKKESFIEKLFRSEKIKYKYKTTIYDDSTMLEVYNFCKNDIKSLRNRYRYINSTYDLYVIYENENDEVVTTHIYYSEQDLHGNKLREKKKFLEEEDFPFPTESYDIYILTELSSKPPPFLQKNLSNILHPVFKLFDTHQISNERKVVCFKTKTIETGIYTSRDIYTHTLPYLIDLQLIYKNDQIVDRPPTKTTYEIKVTGVNLDLCIYYVELDNTGSTIIESNIYDNIPQDIPAPFKIKIKIEIYCNPQRAWIQTATQLLESIEDLSGQQHTLTTTPAPPRKKFIKQDTCCICLENPPNLPYPDCCHVPSCISCEEEQDLTACPICRTKLTVGKIVI